MRLSRSARRRLAAAAASAVLLTGCATDDGDATAGDTADEMSTDEMSTDEMDDEEMSTDGMDDEGTHDDSSDDMSDDMGDEMEDDADEEEASGVVAVSATAPDGSSFSIADFEGPVLVETFATWCSNCRAQLRDTQAAAAAAGDDAVFLALSVETTLDPAELADYAAENGFDDILFGVLDDAGLVTLQEEFGGSVLSPPSTPKFRVDGSAVSELTTGFESTDEILASLGA